MSYREYPAIGEIVYEAHLSNGLRVRVIPKPGFSKCYGFAAVDYGSIDTSFTSDGVHYRVPDGVAHYLEHKLFDMPDGNAMQMFADCGGSPNAFTSYDITAYYVECTEKFRENLSLLLKMVSTPYFTKESVDKERGIIAQEIRMYEDSADSCVYDNLYAAAFAHHPIRKPIAGTVESIQDITEETLYRCYRSFYSSNNMMFCVVGDVEPQMVFDLAEELVPAGLAAPVRHYGPAEEMQPAMARVEKHMEVSMPAFALGFKTEAPAFGDESMRQELIGDLAAEMLVGESSLLYQKLYEANVIDSGFSAGYEGLKGVSMLALSGDSQEPDRILEAVLEEAERIRRDGLEEALFHRLKRSEIGRRIRALDSFESICYRTCAYEFEGVDYFSFPEKYQKVSLEDVAGFLDRTIRPDRAAMSLIYPKEEGMET